MNEDYRLEVCRFLDEEHLEILCDTIFQILEEQYIDQDDFKEIFSYLGRRLLL